jgi:hypothetical protein
VTRDDLAAMLNAQTSACPPARDALLSGGTFIVWDGLVPANRLAHTYRTRLRALAMLREWAEEHMAEVDRANQRSQERTADG